MASFVFKPQPSDTVTRRFSVEVSRAGRGLGRKKQLTAADMMTQTKSVNDLDYPVGVDTKAPVLKSDLK